MLNRSASLAMSTSVLKALPGKLDIKRHSPSILYLLSGVGEPFLEQNTCHCPVFCVLTFSKPSAPMYKRRVFLYEPWHEISNNVAF